MPIMMKRKDGTITPFRNAEYLSAYYFIPTRILEQCGKELNSIPRNPQKLMPLSSENRERMAPIASKIRIMANLKVQIP